MHWSRPGPTSLGCAANAEELCQRKQARQLGIGRTSAGGWHARWLHPKGNKEKLPIVEPSTGSGAVTLTLPLTQIRHEGDPEGSLTGEFTAVFSDADTEGKGQEAMVATSRLRRGDGGSFGRFVRHDGGARLPTWNGSAGLRPNEKLLVELPPLRLEAQRR